jgi:tetratricopeptide (TPR) repeat protein
MNPRNERIIVTLVLIGLLVGAVALYDGLTYKANNIKQAEQLLKEFKIAKAQEILEQTKKRIKKKDAEVDSLMFYSLVKAAKYDDATKFIDKELESVPQSFGLKFIELIDILNANDRSALILKLIDKSQSLKLDQDFFINASQRRNDVSQEFSILETGLKYLRSSRYKKNKKEALPSDKLEDYILRRCIEVSNIFIGSKNNQIALDYLIKAQTLSVLNNASMKDDYYLNLALAYKEKGDTDKAWDNMQMAAKLGNDKAKDMLKKLDKNYKEPEKKTEN